MENSFFLGIISGIGALQGILFALLLMSKKNRQRPDRILLIWFLVFSGHLMSAMGKYLYPSLFPFSILTSTIGFLHGPFFLLYYISLTNRPWRWGDSLHFLPFLIFIVLSFFLNPNFPPSWDIIIVLPKIASLIIYPAFVLYLSTKRMRYLRNNHSSNMVLVFRWIRVIAFLFLLSIGVGLVRMFVELSVGVRYFELWDIIRYVVLLTAIGFFGLKYGVVYKPEEALPQEVEKNYKHSPLKKEEIERYAATINKFIDNNEAYLDPNFSLSALSKSVNIPKHHLSQIINSELNTTFYNLVNTRRVAYALRKLETEDSSKLTFEGLGYESGFNTKSSFYHNFKKVTGKTPKQYLKEMSSS
ncbi:helix-turn-helix domain-containing protein [Flagellimonas sp. S174]|uniref:helix-turn-helix domain-containing protein n=1 Tax=Flagellimonas sp. S174 TaxID=3410790 RepID=UPI003BF4E686